MMYINKANRTDMRMLREVKKVNLCINCKHYHNKVCTNFVKLNLVDGEEEFVLAYEARQKIELCGAGGAYFRHIEKNPLISHPPDLLLEY